MRISDWSSDVCSSALALLQEKGLAHERDYLAHLKAEGRTVVEIAGDASVEEKAARTRAALREGPDVIYQGAFLDGPWQGYADLLLTVPQPSGLGAFPSEVADTKLSRSPNPNNLIQLGVHPNTLPREQRPPQE